MTEHYWRIARRVCTPKELVALELRDRKNLSSRLIAMNLGISRWAVRERLDNADRKIHAALNDDEETAA